MIKVLDADLSVAAAAPPVIAAGAPVTFTLTARNDGPTEAPGVSVIQTLPHGWSARSFVVAPAGAAACSGTTTVTCRLTEALANGASVTIAVTANSPSPTRGTPSLTSTASISSTAPDFNQTNNSAAVALLVSAATPALSPWLLIALGLAMTTIALLRTDK